MFRRQMVKIAFIYCNKVPVWSQNI